MQDHIEVWRTIINNPHSSAAARVAAKKVVLDDYARYRAEIENDNEHPPVTEGKSDTSPRE
jgi:hypothetical protein